MNYQKRLKQYQKGLIKDLTYKFSILSGAKYFSSGIYQHFSVFTSIKKCIKYLISTNRIKSNGMSEENIENIAKSHSNFAPGFFDDHAILDLNFIE